MHLSLIFKTLAPFANNLALYAITFSLYVLCLCFWFAVNCFSTLPLLLVIIFIQTFIGGLGLIITFLSLLFNLRSKSIQLKENCIKKHCDRLVGVEMEFCGGCGWLWKLQIIYGESFAFTKDDVINYLNALNQMLINDLVIFKI